MITTAASVELARLVLLDAAGLQEEEARYQERRAKRRHGKRKNTLNRFTPPWMRSTVSNISATGPVTMSRCNYRRVSARPSSILSKKVAAGASHLQIDMPVGPTAKVRKRSVALQLRKLFEYAGDLLGLHLEVMITDDKQPIGRGIGPVLEARDVMQVLDNDPLAPTDLREKSLQLAGRILEFDADVRGGQGYFVARDILESGRALDQFNSIVKAQGASPKSFERGRLTQDVVAPANGIVTAIDNLQIARIARLAGAPMDKGTGIDLYKKLGDRVRESEPIYRIYSEFNADFEFARRAAKLDNGYWIDKNGT